MIKTVTVQELKVSDVMSREVVVVPFTATVAEATTVLHGNRLSGAPVLSASGKIMGVVSASDLIDPRRDARPDTSIAEVMTRVVFAVKASDPLVLAIRLMLEERIHRVIVIDETGHLAGILSPTDVLRALVPSDALDTDKLGFSYLELKER